MSELISYQLDDGVATLTLANGKVNAISPAVIEAFNQALDHAEQDRAVVILTGQPGILSGGYDLKVMTSGPENAVALVAAGSTLARRMLAHPYPIIVACSGHAVAKGAFLLLSADYRIGVDGPFQIGQRVVKFTGEARWWGTVVADYRTTKGKQRYVVEVEPQGFQMIAVPDQLRPLPGVCTCPPPDKGKAFGKITPGCPIHAQPVDAALFNLPVEGE